MSKRLHKQLLHTIKPGGSGNGWSRHKNWLGCTMRAYLDEQAKAQGNPTSSDTLATLTGTIFHGFQQVYHDSGSFDYTAIEFSHDSAIPGVPFEEARQEAEALFAAYAARHEPSFWGRILGVEEHYEMELDQPPAITCQIDLEVQMRKTDIRRIEKQYPDLMGLLRPGFTIVDWKSESGYRAYATDYYRSLVQNYLYQTIRAENGKTPVQMIFVVCYKTKGHPIYPIVCPPVSENEAEYALEQIDYARARMQEPPEMNDVHCWDYNKPCPWMVSGLCKRSM